MLVHIFCMECDCMMNSIFDSSPGSVVPLSQNSFSPVEVAQALGLPGIL